MASAAVHCGRPRRRPRSLEPAVAFTVYAALSLTFFGRGVVTHLDTRVVGDAGADKTLYMWALRWWPYALQHGRNPLNVDTAWPPHGFDLGLATAGGGLALAAAPITHLLGVVPTYNLLMLAAPALAATSAFVLARRLMPGFGPPLVAGYIFGFSSYELGHVIGHLPLAFVALIPFTAYVTLRRHAGDISRRAFIACLTGVLVAQFLILPQMLFMLVLVATITAAAGLAVLGASTVGQTLVESGIALLAASLFLSPIVVYAIRSEAAAPARSSFAESADVLNYVVPTRRTWIRPPGTAEIAERFTGTGAEQGAYLGLPFAVLVALAVFGRGRSRARTLLAVVVMATVGLSLGTRPKVAGEVVGVGPWSVLAHSPVVGAALPNRLTLFTSLLAGLLVALSLTDRRTLTRWVLVATGVAATLPNFQLPLWSADVVRPQFFARARYAQFIPERATALVLPYGPAGWSMLWHAEAGFRFRLVGGHFGLRVTPPERKWRDVYEALPRGGLEPARLRRFLVAHDVTVVVVTPGTGGRVRRAVEAAVGRPPTHALDALVYAVDPGPA